MNRFKFDALLKEFPFLKELVKDKDPVEIDGIWVKRMDKSLFARVPQYEGATGSLVGIGNGEAVHFILQDGTVMQNAVKDEGVCTHNEAHQDNESWNGETVLEAVERHNVGEKIAYIVWEDYGYDIRDCYSVGGLDFTIYKPPKGKKVLDYLEAARKKAAEKVKAESNF